jgi:hypothetical protein
MKHVDLQYRRRVISVREILDEDVQLSADIDMLLVKRPQPSVVVIPWGDLVREGLIRANVGVDPLLPQEQINLGEHLHSQIRSRSWVTILG